MVDIDPNKEDQLRFVVAPSPTLSSSTLVQVSSTRGSRSRDSPGGGRGVLNASQQSSSADGVTQWSGVIDV